MNDSTTWQRRNGSSSKISASPMIPNPILASHRKQDPPKPKLLPFCRRHSRTILISSLILLTVVLFWKRGGNYGYNGVSITQYSIVFDAGSTGSRVHVYSFSVNPAGERVLLNDDFHQLKPGLSSFSDHPEKGAESLVPLLDAIEGSIPEDLKSATPCELRATAGLRLLPGTQATDLLDSVTELLMNSSYSVTNESVSILDGDQEGAYAWLTVNYLLEKLDSKSGPSVTTIDLGGGSVQESYAMSTPEWKKYQNSGTVVHHGNSKRPVYVHSYLGFGLMAARALILNFNSTPLFNDITQRMFYPGSSSSNPCIPKDYTGTYKYGDSEYTVSNSDRISALRCKTLVREVLNTTAGCDAPADQCTFNGVWGGPRASSKRRQPLYLFSYFWDRAIDVGIIKDRKAVTFVTKPDSFTLKSHELCSLPLEKVKERYPDVEEAHRPFLCMDLTYISALLMDGFKLDPYKDVTLTKQVEYKGNNIETSWTLGAAIDSLSKQHRTLL